LPNKKLQKTSAAMHSLLCYDSFWWNIVMSHVVNLW
jgi:hypothetical protein